MVEFAFYVPVPEKTQVQHNYILLPRGSSFAPKGATVPDPLVFTVNAGATKPGTIAGPKAASAQAFAGDYHSLFDWTFATFLRGVGSTVQIVASNPARFHSVVKQSHRPSEKAVHIKAFRGSKEGYLFFLSTGILWGFKKPLLFIPLERIVAVSYTSVLQRTFNMVVEVFSDEAGGDATEEIEFSMIDQQDYQGIDERYVKKNGLQDRSMAEQRKAKLQLAENIKAAKMETDVAEDEDVEMDDAAADEKGGPDTKNMTALERAEWEEEKRLQDAEDEEEEDYDPGSDGDSDGSGSSSEEESECEGEGEGEGGDDEEDEEDDDVKEEEEEEEEEEVYIKEEETPQLPVKTPATRIGGWAALNK